MATDQGAVKKDSDWQDYTPPKPSGDMDWQDYPAPAKAPESKPIQDTSTISARPSLGSRAWGAFKAGGPAALGEELGNSTREAIGNLPLPGVNKTVGEGLTDLGRMTDMASTEASLLSLPQFGEGVVNLLRGGVPALRAGLARIVRDPTTGKVQTPWEMAVNKVIPDPNAPKAFPARPIAKGTNYGQFLENQKLAAKIPPPEPPLGSPENPGWHSKIPNRMPAKIAGPEGASKIAAPQVTVLPEPRQPMPGDRPGAMWSVGREDVLPGAAQRGTPGAGDVMRNIGQPIIYTPKEGIGYPGPRAGGSFQEYVGAPEAPASEAKAATKEPAPKPHRFSNSARTRQQILEKSKE